MTGEDDELGVGPRFPGVSNVLVGRVGDRIAERLGPLAERPQLGGVADREPFATIKAKLDEGLGPNQVKTAGDLLKDEASKFAGEKLTRDEVSTLDDYLKKQCRYELIKLEGYGLISGGIAVADKQLGTARVWLFLTPRGSSEPIVVTCDTPGLPEAPHKYVSLNIPFSQVSR